MNTPAPSIKKPSSWNVFSPGSIGLIFWILAFARMTHGAVYMTQEEALKVAFPDDPSVKQETVFLTPEQIDEIQKKAKAKLHSEILNYYSGKTGYAFFESHNIRTMPETMMVVIDKEGVIQMVEILAFHEPPDYKASKKWLELFKGKSSAKSFWVKRGLRNITGSTLTTQSIAEGVRRIYSTYEVIVK